MDWVVFGAQWLHVLLGILWFGNSLAIAAFLIPTLNTLPIPVQRQVGGGYGDRAERVFNIVAPLVILLGFVRGTFLGQIKGVDDLFASAYGLTWTVALLAALATYVWGKYAIGSAVRAMNAAPVAPDGSPTPELVAATDRTKRVAVLELLGFIVIFTCMILMRFGL